MIRSKLISIWRFAVKNIAVILAIAAYMITAQLITGTSCFIKSITGLPCPGCGLTRATLELLKGNISGAVHYHPLILLFYLAVAAVLVKYVFFSGFKHTRLTTALAIGLTALFIAVYIARMILYFPHTPPMDYNRNTFIRQLLSLFAG